MARLPDTAEPDLIEDNLHRGRAFHPPTGSRNILPVSHSQTHQYYNCVFEIPFTNEAQRKVLRDIIDKAINPGVENGLPLNRPLPPIPSWMLDVFSRESEERHLAALKILFKNINDLLGSKKYYEVDSLFKQLEPSAPTNIVCGILSITRPASHLLPARKDFFDAAWKVIEKRTKNASELLDGLRGKSYSDGAYIQSLGLPI